MTKNTNVQPNIRVRPLFKAEPAVVNFNFDSAFDELTTLCQMLLEKVGKVQALILYPHRVFRQSAWNIKIIGEQTTAYLLLNVVGRYQGVTQCHSARLTLSVIDDVDAFWLCHYLAQGLGVQPTIPALFSTSRRESEN